MKIQKPTVLIREPGQMLNRDSGDKIQLMMQPFEGKLEGTVYESDQTHCTFVTRTAGYKGILKVTYDEEGIRPNITSKVHFPLGIEYWKLNLFLEQNEN